MNKDTIYRQAAIDAVRSYYDECDTSDKSIEERIEDLPSAQPDLQEYSVWFRIGETLVDVSKMHITAEEGIEKIRSYLMRMKNPERKKGKWHITDAYPHNVYCPVCHKKFAQTHWAVWEDGSLPRNFCPNCGADMRGEEDETD